jgi:hypothetical protein
LSSFNVAKIPSIKVIKYNMNGPLDIIENTNCGLWVQEPVDTRRFTRFKCHPAMIGPPPGVGNAMQQWRKCQAHYHDQRDVSNANGVCSVRRSRPRILGLLKAIFESAAHSC